MDFEKISSFTIDRSSSSIITDNDNTTDIPLWLHLTNEQFQELFRQIVSSTTTTISMKELQQLAMTIYQERKRLDEKQLWSTLLKTIENGLHRWPTLLKQMILSMNIVRNQSIEYFTDEMYSNVVEIYLQKPIIEQILQYETKMENMLQEYIENHFHLFDYDYDHNDEQLVHEIQQQLSHNSNQVRNFFFFFELKFYYCLFLDGNDGTSGQSKI